MGQRKWTDDQLRRAVASQHSWRGVLRALGLVSKSGGSIGTVRRRAAQLDLDASHFTGGRGWSEEDLVRAVERSQSWPEVAERLGLTREPRTGLRLRGEALRLSLEVSHLDKQPPRRPLSDLWIGSQDRELLRHAAPLIAASWFSLRGLTVALPPEPQTYDLLVVATDEIRRVQVKSTTSRAKDGQWRVGIGHRTDKFGPRIPYDPRSIDLFVVITGDGDLYLIPIEAVAGYVSIYLSAYEDYKVGDVSSLLN